jgi:hypothetical protein
MGYKRCPIHVFGHNSRVFPSDLVECPFSSVAGRATSSLVAGIVFAEVANFMVTEGVCAVDLTVIASLPGIACPVAFAALPLIVQLPEPTLSDLASFHGNATICQAGVALGHRVIVGIRARVSSLCGSIEYRIWTVVEMQGVGGLAVARRQVMSVNARDHAHDQGAWRGLGDN